MASRFNGIYNKQIFANFKYFAEEIRLIIFDIYISL